MKFIQSIYRFLGVDSSFEPSNLKVKIASGDFKQTLFGQLFHRRIFPSLKKIGLGWRLKESAVAGKIFYWFTDIYVGSDEKSRPVISEEDRNYLNGIYRGDVQKLEKLINKNLSYWK